MLEHHSSITVMTISKTTDKYCIHCDKTGIIHNPHFEELNEVPLSPCPKCVLTKCSCGGEDPFYTFKDGQVYDCFCRETRTRINRINSIYDRSGIEKKYRWKRLGDFKPVTKLVSEAKNYAYDIVQNFPDISKGLFLWGNPGTGKTLLSSIILTELIIHNVVEGKYIKISSFFSRLKSTFVEGSDNYGESSRILRNLSEVDVLVIDDFGVQKDTPYEQTTLYDLVDARYEAEKFTIFTSNRNPVKALNELSEGRILSRIREMARIFEISGEDYRKNL